MMKKRVHSVRHLIKLAGFIGIAAYSIDGYKRVRGDSVYRWWDILDVARKEEKCEGYGVFRGTLGLRVLCDDRKVGDDINKQIRSHGKKKSGYMPVVIPAQTLFYRLEAVNKERLDGMIVTWNDFMKREAVVSAVELHKRIETDYYCENERGLVVMLFETSRQTLEGSLGNFGKNQEMTEYPQFIIEGLFKREVGGKCVKRQVYEYRKGRVFVLTVG